MRQGERRRGPYFILEILDRKAPDEAPRALKELLARASEMPDFETLQAKLWETLAGVHQLFEKQLR